MYDCDMDHRSLIAFLAGSLPANEFSAEIRAEVRACNDALASGGVGSIIVTDAPETRVTREHASRLLEAVADGTFDFELANYVADALIMSDDFDFEDEAVSEAIFFLEDDSRAPTEEEIAAALVRLRSASSAESILVAAPSLTRPELGENDRYTRGQKLILAIGLPFGLTILAVNISSALGASEPIKDNIVLAGMSAFLIGLGWAAWTWVRRPRG